MTDTTKDGGIDFAAAVEPRKTDFRSDLNDALHGNPFMESDAEKLEKARRIARARAAYDIVQNRDADKDDTDEQKWAKALTLAETMLGGGIDDDVFLRDWNGGRDFESGQKALDKMRELMARPDQGPEREYRETAQLPYEERVKIAMEDLSLTKKLSHFAGSVSGDVRDAILSGAANGSGSVWAGGAGNAENVKPKTEEEKTAERQAWERQVHDAYMSKLARKARGANLAAIMTNPVFALEENANAPKVLRDLLNSPDNAVPLEDTAMFLGLTPDAQELIVSARQVMKPDYEGGFADWCHDMGVTAVNTAVGVLTAGFRQGAKWSGIAAGCDVNELNRRRQRLYAATGRFFAGGDLESGTLPEMQFERRCEEFGVVGDALIGAVSCLGYMTTAGAGGPMGVAAMALEGMQQMDDQVVAGGGDIGSFRYNVANAIFGGLYGYTERLQFGGFLKGWTEEATREAFFDGLVKFIMKSPKEAAVKWGVTGFTESVEEGIQRGIQEINVAMALDKDATKAFAEGFVEDFVGAIPTMFVIGPGGDVVGHARRSGFRLGDEGQANRVADLGAWREYDIERNKLVAERMRDANGLALKRLAEYEAAYETYQNGGIGAVQKKFGITDERAAELEEFYKAIEADRNLGDGATKAEFDRVRDEYVARAEDVARSLRADFAKEIEDRNAKNAEEREERVEKFLSREFWEKYRKAWAKGNALVTVETKDGKQRITTDLGAEELVKAGLGRKTAERMSEYFRREREIGYSAAATERIRELYDKATDWQTTTAKRLAATLQEGDVETRDGRTFIKYRVADGEGGSRQFGEVEVVDEFLSEWEPEFDEPRLNDAQSIERATGGEVTVEQWMNGMSAEERRNVWYGWNGTGLARQGGIELVDSRTGVSITSGQIAQMIDAGEKPSVSAKITVDPSMVEAAPIHEYAHGFVAFAASAGLLSKDELSTLGKVFGAARGGNELFNEENFADGFRDYLVKRRAGAAVPESEAKSIFEKIYNFGKKVAAEGERRDAEQKVAEKAMKAVTDQMEVTAANAEAAKTSPVGKPENKGENGDGGLVSGEAAKTSPVKPVVKSPTLRADIDAALVTDKSKGGVVPRTKVVEFSEVPEILAGLGVPRDAKIISRADILRKVNVEHHLKPEDIAELPDRYSAPVAVFRDGDNFIVLTDLQAKANDGTTKPVMVYLRAAKENGKYNFIASAYARDKDKESAYVQWSNEGRLLWLDETKAAKCGLEEGTVSQFKPKSHGGSTASSISKPAAEVKRVEFTALTPTGNRKVGGHYEVVPLAELMDSNQPGYPTELQGRDRKDNKAEEQTRKDHVANFEPGYLLADPGTDGGAPLVVRKEIDGKVRLVVVSGNGRTMILQALAERKLYDRYRGAMRGWADANGVGVGVGDEANPVLVRVIDDLGGATLKEIADLSNTNAIQQMNEDERARADADVIRTLGIAKLYQANADGSPDMTPGANDEFFAAFQRGVGQNDALYNPDGTLTQTARDRAVRALVAIAVGQGERGRDTVKKLSLQAETLGLVRQRNAAAAMAAAVADLERKPEYAIGADVSRAYADYMDFLEQKKAGKVGTLGEYVAQQDMLDRRSEIAEGVLELLGGANARQIAETVKTYCRAAEGEDPAGNLFGAARTREQVWRDAVAAVEADAIRHSFASVDPDALEVAGVGTPKIAADLLTSTRWSFGNSYADGKLSDNELIAAFRRGDADALAELYRRYDAPRLANGTVGGVVGLIERWYSAMHPEDKEDLHSKVWERIVRDLNGTKDFGKFKFGSTYVFNAVRWTALGYFRKELRHPMESLDAPVGDEEDADTFGATISNEDNPWGGDADRRAKREMLRSLFGLLPKRQAAVMQAMLDGKTVAETAKELGVSRSTVDGERSRAVLALMRAGRPKGQKGVGAAEEPQAGQVPRDFRDVGSLPQQFTRRHAGTLGTVSAAPDADINAASDENSLTRISSESLDDNGETRGSLEIAAAKLSKREQEIYDLTKNGMLSKDISKKLGISVSTVDNYYHLAKKKLGIKERRQRGTRFVNGVALGEREWQVFGLVRQGLSSKQIALKLGISTSSVDNHYASARKKLGIESKYRGRASFAPKGVQKGAAVEYPDAAEELRVMDDAAPDAARWSVAAIGGHDIAIAETEPLTTNEAQNESKVRAILNSIVGHEYAQLGEDRLVKVGAKFPDEFWGSNTSQKLRDKVDKLWRAKVSSVPILKDIIATTKLGPKEAAEHLNAKFKERADFYRCSTEFGIKRWDGVAVYKCDLLILEMRDTGLRYVYDIVKISKPTLTAKSSLDGDLVQRLYGQANLTGESATPHSISNPAAADNPLAARMDAYEKNDSAGQLVAFADGKRQTPIAEYVGIIAQRVRDFNRAAAFKAWFGDSKVVDADGKPLVVYHGTNNDKTTEIWNERTKTYDIRHDKFWTFKGGQHYFNSSEDNAGGYGNEIYAVYLRMVKPLVIDCNGSDYDTIPYGGKRYGSYEIGELAKRKGFDGVILKNIRDGVDIGALQTQTTDYIVFDSRQIKSATDNRGTFDPTNPDIRWSIGARRRAEFRELIGRKRPDVAPEDVEAYLDEIAGYDNAKKQKLAVHWLITGAIELPEDAYKLDKAIATAERAKVDPFQYRNPEDIFAAFPQHLPKEKPIDPDTVPELTGKTDMGHGVTVYDAQDDREGQRAMRRIINTHFGKDASPWCLLQGEGDTGELSDQAWHYWQHYSALPKKVAFLNGRLLAFMATEGVDRESFSDFVDPRIVEKYREEFDQYNHFLESDEGIENNPTFFEWYEHEYGKEIEPPEQWWDRKDASHGGIPIEGKIAGDPLGRSGLQELKDGELVLVGRMWKGDRKNGKYEEWDGEQKTLDAEFKDGRPVGWRRAYRNGELSTVEHYNAKSEHDRPQLEFYPGLGLASVIEYGEGDVPLRSMQFETDGSVRRYQEVGGPGGLAKKSLEIREDRDYLSWTDDSGDYYGVIGDFSNNGVSITFAKKIAKGTYGDQYLDLSDTALRAKLEGESAAILEAVKAEASAIYREYSANDGAAQDPSFAKAAEDKSGARWSVAPQVDTPEFKAWFGKSKVVDRAEKPLVVYHGTPDGRFTVFHNNDSLVVSEAKKYYQNYWFAASRDLAKTYERKPPFDIQNAVPDTKAVYLRIVNPLVIDAKGKGWAETQEIGHSSDAVRRAIDQGYDGIIIKNVRDSYDGKKIGDTYCVFNPEQIKSATDNRGSFDLANPDIRYSFAKAEVDRNVDEMLSKLDEAKGKSREEIFKQYDFHQKIIGQLPIGIKLPESVSVSNPVVKCAQNYLLAHLVVNDAEHHEVKITADDAKRIIGLIDPANEMRLVEQRGSHSIAFIGQREDGTWDCICIAPKRGEYYVFKTMFAQKKKPYQDKSLIRFSVAPELGRTLGPDITGETPRPDATSIRGASTTPRSIPNSAAADNPLSAIANAKTTREVEAAARMSFSARLADGDEGAAERALVNYVAYHKLTGGAIPRPTTLAKLGLALGMKTVQAKRIIEDAQRVADRAAGTVIEKAARNGDVGTAFSLMEREKEREEELRKIISGGAKAGGDLVLGGVVAQGTLLGKRVEQTMRGMTAATLADMEGDTGLDLAAEILQNDPKAFDDEIKKGRGMRDEGRDGEGGDSEDGSSSPIPDPSSLSDRERWMRAEAAKEAAKRVAAFIEAAKQRAEENRRKAEERRAREAARMAAGEDPSDGGESGSAPDGQPSGMSDPNAPEKSVAGFKNKWEFAAFVRKWAEDKYAQTHGMTSLGKSEENRLFAEFYRICVRQQLQDLADKLLDPKGARAWANRRIGELEEGLRPDTIERASANIFAFINRNAIREERVKLIEKFRKEIKQFITGAEFEELKQDPTRRLTGWVEEAARYMMKVCQLSAWAANGGTSQFERERERLVAIIQARRDVYAASGADPSRAEKEDKDTIKAMWMLPLLEKFGAMAQMMPGEIEDLKTDAIRYLTEEAAALEEIWKDAKAKQEDLRRKLAGGIEGPNGQKFEEGFFEKLFDSLNGMLRLRLKHLVRFAGKKERADAEGAINEIVTMLGQGEVAYAREVQKDRQEFMRALGRIFQDREGRPNRRAIRDYLKRMEEPIPAELSRQISNQGYAETMTYGQMLQLLVSLEQRSYAENVRIAGREGQAELIRNSAAFTTADALFIDWLRAFYAAKRETISKVTERMTGMKVESPDPLYCPVKTYRKDVASDLHRDSGRWNAIDEVLSSRVRHTRDFDESASILGQFYDRSNRMAGLVAWAERGTLIRNVVCSAAVQQRIRLAFGGTELDRILRQLEDTFNGGTSRSKTPGEIIMMDKAMNFITFGYLGFNPLSAIKQTTSFPVWANVLPGGFRELWHHMTHIDRDAVRHIMESDEYKVRYGDDTGSGQDLATKTLSENAGQNPFVRLMTGPGMWLLKKGDFLPGVWIMQGVYKSLLNKHLNEGMEESAADRLALTEAFNLLEETQQSGRTYNTSALAREHGRLGAALVQFATSPLQQLQYESQALREWMDLRRYGADAERIAEARAKLIRAVFINHVLMPAAMELVIAVFRAIMGDEPRWEKDGYAWDLLRDVLLGQASRIFYVGVLASSVMDALFKRQLPRGSQLIPSEGAITIMANVAVTAHDVMAMDGEKVRKDLERMVKSLAPTRIPYNLYRRVTGDSDVDRKRAKSK